MDFGLIISHGVPLNRRKTTHGSTSKAPCTKGKIFFGLYLTQAEGYVLGMSAKMFTIAGPVLVFGISFSVVYGLILILFGIGG